MSYAQNADFLKRYDARVTGDLVSDIGQRVPDTQLPTDPNLQASLDDAAGEIDSACLVAGRYTTTQLGQLTGQDQAFLFRLNCDLAFGLLLQRRGNDTKDVPQYQRAREMLDMLRRGERVFNVALDISDGNPTSEFPSVTQQTNLNLLRTAVEPFFPARREQSTLGTSTGA